MNEVEERPAAQVIVVGAGPTGLWLAAELALAGVCTLVLERDEQRSPHSKAMGLHPRTLETLAMRGMVEQFLTEGTRVPNWHFGMLESRLDFTGLDTPFPFMLAYPQVRTEQLLERRAMDLGVSILTGHTVTGLVQDGSSVTVEVVGADGAMTLTAAFVVGCDGAGSTVRKAAGIDFPGTEATAYGFLGEVILDDPPSTVVSRHNAEGAVIVLPVGGGRYRVTGFDPANQHAGDELTLAALRAVTRQVTGTDYGMREPGWLTRFGNATRLAATYRKDRVLLAGDAAHMHWPAGGVGLNVGVQDAMNLGWKLAAVVQGRATAALLDSYHSERHPVGQALVEHTLAQSALITAVAPDGQALRSILTNLLRSHPQVERAIANKLAALDITYTSTDPAAHPLVGTRTPLTEPDSTLVGALRAGRPVLLDLSGNGLGTAADFASAMGIQTHPSPPAETGGTQWSGVGAAIIRPDGHVWQAIDASANLEAALTHTLDGLGVTFNELTTESRTSTVPGQCCPQRAASVDPRPAH
jgi:2-polyprenyl-6-methoxyphenol hydroxylase-like FAD-dependent oxidoreductase